jgi:hypothetical protein
MEWAGKELGVAFYPICALLQNSLLNTRRRLFIDNFDNKSSFALHFIMSDEDKSKKPEWLYL